MATCLIYEATPSTSVVANNGVLPLTTLLRKRGCATLQGTNSVILTKAGYYEITSTITFTAPATGTASVQAQLNGTNVVGATASTSILTANTEIRSLTINAIVRVFCNQENAVLTLLNSGIAIATSNVSLSVKYLG